MSDVRRISERISYKQHEGFLTVAISPRLDDKKQFLLTFWIFAWTFCGLFVLFSIFLDYPGEVKRIMFIFLFFWAYYEYRIGYVWLWRRKGVELLKIEEGKLVYKRSIRQYGKAYEFYIDNIKEFGLAEVKPGYATTLSQSFWVIGGERLRFMYQDREVKFGVQITDDEAEKLRKFLNEKFVTELKRIKENQV